MAGLRPSERPAKSLAHAAAEARAGPSLARFALGPGPRPCCAARGPLDDPKVEVSEEAAGTFVGNTVIGVGTAPITILKETGKAIGGALDKLLGGDNVQKKKKE